MVRNIESNQVSTPGRGFPGAEGDDQAAVHNQGTGEPTRQGVKRGKDPTSESYSPAGCDCPGRRR